MALAIALIGWGGAWLWIKGMIEHDLDARATQLTAAGGRFAWSDRRIRGYPFRFDIDFSSLTWVGPDGWGVSAPELRSETSVFAFGHWVAYAPAGAILIRPHGGAVGIGTQVLRISLSETSSNPPDFSLEGQGLTFTPRPGAAPYPLAGAGQLHIHTRAGPANQGTLLFELDDARASPGTRLSAVAGGGAVNLAFEAIYDHADALAGLGWTPAIRSWTIDGGKAQIRQLSFRAGAFELEGHGAGIAIDQDGRVEGELGLTRGAATLAALSNAGATQASRNGEAGAISFQAGRMTVGSLVLGRSPKVY